MGAVCIWAAEKTRLTYGWPRTDRHSSSFPETAIDAKNYQLKKRTTMTKKIVRTERFEENLYQLQKQNKEQAAFLAEVRQLAARARMDMICGSWIAPGGGLSLLVRRCSTGYTIMVCDTSRCYKTIVREMLAKFRGDQLVVEADGRNEAMEIVFNGDGLLHCGTYGVFCMEENLLHEEMQSEIDFALRSNIAGDEDE